MCFDNVLENIGGVGYFQIILLFSMSFAKFLIGSNISLPVFTNFVRQYTCKLSNGQIINSTEICSTASYLSACTGDKLIFDDEVIQTTIQSQYSLICKRNYFASLSTSIFFGGFLLGGPLYGIISDKYGRMKALSLCSLHSVLTGLTLPFMPNIWFFLIWKLVHGIAISGIVTINNVAYQEFVPASQRLNMQMIYNTAKPAGTCILVLVGYFVRKHCYLQLAIASIGLPTTFFVFLFPESPRWLISRGEIDKAYKAVCVIAKCNGKSIVRQSFEQFLHQSVIPQESTNNNNMNLEKISNDDKQSEMEVQPEVEVLSEESIVQHNFRRILKHKVFCSVSFAIYLNFFSCVVTNTMLLLAADQLGYNVYSNLLLLAMVEIIGSISIIFIGRYLGRVTIFTGGLSMAVILTINVAIFFKNNELVTVVLALCANFFIASITNFIWVYSFEVFPTPIRTSFTGVFPIFGGVGCILVPLIIDLHSFWIPAPFVITSILLSLAAFSSVLYPETKGQGTPETVEEGLILFKKNLLWRKIIVPAKNSKLDQSNKLL